MLPDTDKQDRDIGGMDKADKRANHVAHRVALGDDEAVQGADRPKGGVEVSRLGHRVGAHQSLRVC